MSLHRKLLLLSIATASLFLCHNAVAATGDPSRDAKTGVTFPKRLGVFEREGGIKYDAGGNPMATYLAGRLILLDAFYYKDNSFATEYSNCRDYVKIMHPEARLVSDGPSNLHASGRRAVFTFQDKFLGGDRTKLISELMMFPHRDRYIKFRVTYPAAHADRARREIDSFARALKLP
jgi:hypothetical protein